MGFNSFVMEKILPGILLFGKYDTFSDTIIIGASVKSRGEMFYVNVSDVPLEKCVSICVFALSRWKRTKIDYVISDIYILMQRNRNRIEFFK